MEVEFTPILTFFWLKGKISVEGRHVTIAKPNRVGLVPFGTKETSIPASQISNVQTSFR